MTNKPKLQILEHLSSNSVTYPRTKTVAKEKHFHKATANEQFSLPHKQFFSVQLVLIMELPEWRMFAIKNYFSSSNGNSSSIKLYIRMT